MRLTNLVVQVFAVEGVHKLLQRIQSESELLDTAMHHLSQPQQMRRRSDVAHMSSWTLGVAEAVRAMMGTFGYSHRNVPILW